MSYNDEASVAVVTGGVSGLGNAFVRALTTAGHRVAVIDRVDPTSNAHPGALYHLGDATSPKNIAAFARRVREELGHPRVLVNNVGASPFRTFAEETLE